MKLIHRAVFLLGACLILQTNLCQGLQTGYNAMIDGSNRVIRDIRQLPPTDSISVSGPVTLVLKQSSQEQLVIEAEHNILPLIDVSRSGRTLQLNLNGQYIKTNKRVTFTVTISELKSLQAYGQVLIDGQSGVKASALSIGLNGAVQAKIRLASEKLIVKLQGQSSLDIFGNAAKQDIVISGHSIFQGQQLKGANGQLLITGQGTGNVNIQKNLTVEIQSSGTAIYQGRPVINKQIAQYGQLISGFESHS